MVQEWAVLEAHRLFLDKHHLISLKTKVFNQSRYHIDFVFNHRLAEAKCGLWAIINTNKQTINNN